MKYVRMFLFALYVVVISPVVILLGLGPINYQMNNPNRVDYKLFDWGIKHILKMEY